MLELPKKGVVLLSGGLDSTTLLAIAKKQGFDLYALSFEYGQRQQIEIKAARQIAQRYGVTEHRVVQIDLSSYGGSALTSEIPVPKDRSDEQIGTGVPITYVPARNMVFLSHAVAWAEVLGARDIFIGVNAVDYSGYPDCRPEFIDAFERVANLGTGAGSEGLTFSIHAPLSKMTKAEIIRCGIDLGVDYELTHSCYDPQGDHACGRCDACKLRRDGFAAAEQNDPTRYATQHATSTSSGSLHP